jgi:signal transduction histidine kinase
MAMAVRTDNTALLGILRKAMAYVGVRAGADFLLRYQPARAASRPFSLSEAEQAWLLRHGPVRAGFDSAFFPLSYANPDGQADGYSIQLFRRLRDRAGLAVREVGGPWNEVLAQTMKGDLDVLVASARSPERTDGLLFVGPYLSAPTVIVTRQDRSQVWNLAELAGRKLALLDGHFLLRRIAQAHPEITLLPVGDQSDALEAVASGRADAAIGNLYAVNRLIQSRYLGRLFIAGHVPDGDSELYIAVNRRLPELAAILERALASLAPQDIVAAKNTWLDTVYRSGLSAREIAGTFLPLLGALTLLLAVSALWNARLGQEVARREAAQRALEAGARELAAANEQLELFAASAAHDLKAPLRHISGYAGRLGDAVAQEDRVASEQMLSRIRDAVKAEEALIDGLLELGQLARRPLRRKWVDLSAVAEAAWQQLRSTHPGSTARFECERGLRAEADLPLLASLLGNLLSNALKFSACNPAPHIRLEAVRGDGVPAGSFQICDNGIGIPETERDKLFRPFSRLGNARGVAGHGLGLATVQRIVARHGGTIAALDQPGGGTCMRFSLPPTEIPASAQSRAAANVLQAATCPCCSPVWNQRTRWAELPWVKLSGTAKPRACCCRRSSPIAVAALSASSTSPASSTCRARSA